MDRGQRAPEEDEKRMKELDARIKRLSAKPKLSQVKIEPLAPETVAVTHATIRNALKDPESAHFGELRGGRAANGVLHVCGWVNAKNSFGGYTAMTPFTGVVIERPIGDPNKKAVAFLPTTIGGTDLETMTALAICEERGLALR